MRRSIGAVTRREAVAISVAALALTIYFTWPMALRPASVGRVEMGDGQFSIWNVAWVAHALTTPGAAVFDANIFHPHRSTLAYSEANLGAGLVAVPAYLITGNPYAAHNSVVLIGLTFSVIGMYLLARRLTGDPAAALVAAVVFAFCPFLFARTAHIQLMMTAPMPFALLAFHRFADRVSVPRAVVLGVAIAVQALFCAYYGILTGLLVGLGVLTFAVMRGLWREPRWWYLSLLAALVSLLIVLPFFLPYLTLQEETGFRRALADSNRYSADWRAYFASSAWAHRWMLPIIERWKEVLFPGFTAVVLGGYGMFASLRQRGDNLTASPLERPVTVFYLLAFIVALWSSFGPPGGLYSVLYQTIPVFSLLRAPGRFGLAVTLALAVFAAAGVTLLLRRVSSRTRPWAGAALVILAVAELSTTIRYLPARGVPRPYKMLAVAERGPVAEFPFYYLPHDRFRQTLYMLGSTAHWQPLVNGYSDYIPRDVVQGGALLEGFPNPAGFEWLRERGTRYVVFHFGLYDGPSGAALRERIRANSSYLRPKYVQGTVHLYEIVAWPSTELP
jgi:hypothetical protein